MNVTHDTPEHITDVLERYGEAWQRRDVEGIMALHAPDMEFQNHMSGVRAQGAAVRDMLSQLFERWPDFTSFNRRQYVGNGLAVVEWTASGSHVTTIEYEGHIAEPTGAKIEWSGVDILPFENGLIKRK